MLKTRNKTCARCYHSDHPARNLETRQGAVFAESRRDKTSLSGRLHRLLKGVFKHRPRSGVAVIMHATWQRWQLRQGAPLSPTRCRLRALHQQGTALCYCSGTLTLQSCAPLCGLLKRQDVQALVKSLCWDYPAPAELHTGKLPRVELHGCSIRVTLEQLCNLFDGQYLGHGASRPGLPQRKGRHCQRKPRYPHGTRCRICLPYGRAFRRAHVGLVSSHCLSLHPSGHLRTLLWVGEITTRQHVSDELQSLAGIAESNQTLFKFGAHLYLSFGLTHHPQAAPDTQPAGVAGLAGTIPPPVDWVAPGGRPAGVASPTAAPSAAAPMRVSPRPHCASGWGCCGAGPWPGKTRSPSSPARTGRRQIHQGSRVTSFVVCLHCGTHSR